MKNFSFDGRLGSDAELKTTKGGKPYVRFSVANNSFSGGVETTEWIDVTSYDPYVVENRVKYLTKGTYVIINGDVRFDVRMKDQKIWKNVYVTAYSIDTPNFGKRDEEQTATQVTDEAPATAPVTEPVVAATYTPQPTVTESAPTAMYQPHVAQPSEAQVTVGGGMDDENLPF